jgi:GTP 3',8-cyclase
MPLDEYEWIDKKEILSFEEITRLASLLVRLGVEKIRLTGGEPLVRRDLDCLVANLSAIADLKDLCLTTNGALLTEKIEALKRAGLKRVNVSLDTLDPQKFRRMTKRGDLAKVLEGIFSAKKYGLHPIKLNAVIERGVNEDDILDLVEFSRQQGFAMRFIEYMDVGTCNRWKYAEVVPSDEIRQRIEEELPLIPLRKTYEGEVADRYAFADGKGEIGFISSVTQPFCGNCSRARISAEGKMYTCLFAASGTDLKTLLRKGATDGEIYDTIAGVWLARKDRYSEDPSRRRAAVHGRRQKARRRPRQQARNRVTCRAWRLRSLLPCRECRQGQREHHRPREYLARGAGVQRRKQALWRRARPCRRSPAGQALGW